MANLRLLWLSDNPLALSQLYRMDVLACFPQSQRLLLDGKRHRRAEHETASLRAQVCRHGDGSAQQSVLSSLHRGCRVACQIETGLAQSAGRVHDECEGSSWKLAGTGELRS